MKVNALAMVLVATLPVACGSYNPTAPEPTTLSSDEGGSASINARRVAPSPVLQCQAKSIRLGVTRNSVSATYLDGNGLAIAQGCTAPTWTATPSGRLALSSSGFEAKLMAPTGTYTVIASGYGVWATVGVIIK